MPSTTCRDLLFSLTDSTNFPYGEFSEEFLLGYSEAMETLHEVLMDMYNELHTVEEDTELRDEYRKYKQIVEDSNLILKVPRVYKSAKASYLIDVADGHCECITAVIKPQEYRKLMARMKQEVGLEPSPKEQSVDV